MGLFDTGTPSTLADVLGQQADTASLGIENAYARKRKQAAAQAGASGRLRSGVQNYTVGDINSGELSDLGNVQSSLAGALGEIPSQDYLDSNNYDRSRQLAELIARLNQDSGLSKIFGLTGSALNLGGKILGAAGGAKGA